VSPTVVANAASARVGGGLTHVVRQLSALERVRPDLDLKVLAAPWNVEALRGALDAPVRLVPVPAASARFAYEQLVLPWQLRPDDILYCPGNFAPLALRRSKTVLVLQNPNYVGAGREHQANQRPRRRLKIRLCERSLLAADRVVVVSNALGETLFGDLPQVVDRTVVIRGGAPVWPDEEVAPPGFPLPTGHLLSLANDYPHKNLDAVVDAWVRCFADAPAAAPALVMAGEIAEGRRHDQQARVPVGLRSRLRYLGPVVDRRHVRWLLSHAAAMVAPSALEAAPHTPTEAGSLGCPVIVSDIAAHREVAGDHAIYVRVGDVEGLTAAVAAVVHRPPARARWSWRRTWEDNARDLAGVFDDLSHVAGRRPARR
jgi:glycosyltransferase involved in cell wall biosynthesis